METPELPEVEPPPPEIVSAVVASMRGGTVEESAEVIAARELYRARQHAAEKAAMERRQEIERQRLADQAAAQRLRERQERDERSRQLKEKTRATAAKIEALSNGPDRRLDEISAGIRRSDAWRNALITHGRQQEFTAHWDEIFAGMKEAAGIRDPLPVVRLESDEE